MTGTEAHRIDVSGFANFAAACRHGFRGGPEEGGVEDLFRLSRSAVQESSAAVEVVTAHQSGVGIKDQTRSGNIDVGDIGQLLVPGASVIGGNDLELGCP